MTFEIWITLSILVVAIILFVTERLRVDIVALMVVITSDGNWHFKRG